MRPKQRIRPLWWCLPVWFLFVSWNYLRQWLWYANINSPVATDCHLQILAGIKTKVCAPLPLFNFELLLAIITVLMFVHLMIYWAAFSFKLSQKFLWLFLAIQTALILLLCEVLRNTHVTLPPISDITLGLSIPMIAAIIDLFKRTRQKLLASGSYLVVIVLYSLRFETQVQYLWNKETVYAFLSVLILAGAILYLQMEHTHERTRELLKKLDSAHSQLSAYALRVEELTILTERQRLARDLHDTLSQGLVGLVMQLDAANTYFGKAQPAQAQEVIAQAINRARTILTETRYVIHDLRAGPPRPDDLPELVQEEVERFTAVTGIVCETELEGLSETLPGHTEHVLRAITEGLANITRHACASRVQVRATARENLLEIEICDDGIGFDPATVEALPGHYGLIGMRERARLLGGQFEIISSPGQGTCIRTHVPNSGARSLA